jgi:hypothetical protein
MKKKKVILSLARFNQLQGAVNKMLVNLDKQRYLYMKLLDALRSRVDNELSEHDIAIVKQVLKRIELENEKR